MIVPTMTIQEIHKELFEDVKNLRAKLEACKKDFGKKVLKVSRFPFTKSYDCKTKENKNIFIVTFTALKRSSWDKPIYDIKAIYTRPEGRYAASLSLDTNLTSIYQPHFFKRYRERIVKDEFISNEDIIRRYFKNDWGFTGAVVNEDFKSVYHSFETDDENDKVSFVAAVSEGYCFGEKQGNVNVFKTIISEDMLFENQKPLFGHLKSKFNECNKERYGMTI